MSDLLRPGEVPLEALFEAVSGELSRQARLAKNLDSQIGAMVENLDVPIEVQEIDRLSQSLDALSVLCENAAGSATGPHLTLPIDDLIIGVELEAIRALLRPNESRSDDAIVSFF